MNINGISWDINHSYPIESYPIKSLWSQYSISINHQYPIEFLWSHQPFTTVDHNGLQAAVKSAREAEEAVVS